MYASELSPPTSKYMYEKQFPYVENKWQQKKKKNLNTSSIQRVSYYYYVLFFPIVPMAEFVRIGYLMLCKDNIHCHSWKPFLSFRVIYKISFSLPPIPHSSLAPSKFQASKPQHTPDYYSTSLSVCCHSAPGPHIPAELLGARTQGRRCWSRWLLLQVPRAMPCTLWVLSKHRQAGCNGAQLMSARLFICAQK